MKATERPEIIITPHARQRIHERVKIPLRAVKTFVHKSIRKGKVWPDLKGGLRNYVRSKQDNPNISCAVAFRGFVLLWADNTLVTIVPIPGIFSEHRRK